MATHFPNTLYNSLHEGEDIIWCLNLSAMYEYIANLYRSKYLFKRCTQTLKTLHEFTKQFGIGTK